MIGGGHHDAIDLTAGCVEDAPEILELPGLREPLRRSGAAAKIRVAEDDNVLVFQALQGCGRIGGSSRISVPNRLSRYSFQMTS